MNALHFGFENWKIKMQIIGLKSYHLQNLGCTINYLEIMNNSILTIVYDLVFPKYGEGDVHFN